MNLHSHHRQTLTYKIQHWQKNIDILCSRIKIRLLMFVSNTRRVYIRQTSHIGFCLLHYKSLPSYFSCHFFPSNAPSSLLKISITSYIKVVTSHHMLIKPDFILPFNVIIIIINNIMLKVAIISIIDTCSGHGRVFSNVCNICWLRS